MADPAQQPVRAAPDPWAVIEAVFPKARPNPPERPAVVFGSAAPDTAYALSALESEVQRVVDAPEGTRNHTLNRAAFSLGQLVAGGALEQDDVINALTHAAQQAGLEGIEITRTIQSGLSGGQKDPRGVPEKPDVDGWLHTLPTAKTVQTTVNTETGEIIEVERTSWWPRDLGPIIAGDITDEPAPAFLARQDGHRLFYAGKVNALIGESESGKTWIGLLAVVQALQVGQQVLYLDFEDTAPGIVARLRLMGVTDKQLRKLHYIGPDEALDVVGRRDLADHMLEHPPVLILFDGVNAAMTLLGLDLEKNKDATQFSLTLLRPLKRTGAAVITIDHVTKSKDNRGSYAIGAQAKRADIDGCALLVEVVQPFGKGMRGKLKLTVSKDRPGQVRAVSGGAKHAGYAHLDSTAGDRTDCWIEAPDLRPPGEKPAFRPTVLMERVSAFLQQLPEGDGVATRAVIAGVSGNDKATATALQTLVNDGFVERTVKPSGAMLHRSVRPYVADLDPLADQGVATVAKAWPSVATDAGQDRGPVAPPLSGGRVATDDNTSAEADDTPDPWWQK